MNEINVSKLSDKEREEFKTWTRGLLHDEIVKNLCITFTKQDGDERKLYCTLVGSQIPEDKHPKGTSTRAPTPEVQKVFDVDEGEWRSFRWDSVISVSFDLGEAEEENV